jgi:hypothetical protein
VNQLSTREAALEAYENLAGTFSQAADFLITSSAKRTPTWIAWNGRGRLLWNRFIIFHVVLPSDSRHPAFWRIPLR